MVAGEPEAALCRRCDIISSPLFPSSTRIVSANPAETATGIAGNATRFAGLIERGVESSGKPSPPWEAILPLHWP